MIVGVYTTRHGSHDLMLTPFSERYLFHVRLGRV